MNDNIEKLNTVIENITNIPKRYELLNSELDLTNAKQMDILHDIENSKFNACEGYKKIKELQDLRKHRRELKNEIDILEPLYKWYGEHKKIEVDLFKVKTTMERIKDNRKNWKYTSRVEQLEGNREAAND